MWYHHMWASCKRMQQMHCKNCTWQMMYRFHSTRYLGMRDHLMQNSFVLCLNLSSQVGSYAHERSVQFTYINATNKIIICLHSNFYVTSVWKWESQPQQESSLSLLWWNITCDLCKFKCSLWYSALFTIQCFKDCCNSLRIISLHALCLCYYCSVHNLFSKRNDLAKSWSPGGYFYVYLNVSFLHHMCNEVSLRHWEVFTRS